MIPEEPLTTDSPFPALQKDKLRLYSNKLCPFAHRTRLVLAHKNIEHEVVNISLSAKPTWFLSDITQLGLVPVLQCNDTVVYDSKICNVYLDDVYPGEKLVPADPYQRAKDQMLLERIGKVTGPYYRLKKSADSTEFAEELKNGLAIFEQELGKRNTPFFGGEKPMNIDFLIWPHFERVGALEHMENGFQVTDKNFPNLSHWMEAMTQLPAVKATMASPEEYIGLSKKT